MCTLYDRIMDLCKQKGVSGSRMCLDLGLSKSTLSDIKGGRKKGISTASASKIAGYLNVSVDYLLGEEETPEIKNSPSAEITEGEQQLLDLFRLIPESQQPLVLQMIRAALDATK